jgi:hypothetical protein
LPALEQKNMEHTIVQLALFPGIAAKALEAEQDLYQCQSGGCHEPGAAFCDECMTLLCAGHAHSATGIWTGNEYIYCRRCFRLQVGYDPLAVR